jgi:hypothetical protein
LAGDEFDRLVEAVDSRRLGARALELLDGIGLRSALATAAGVAAFEFIVGEEFDVIPPGLAAEMRSGLSSASSNVDNLIFMASLTGRRLLG